MSVILPADTRRREDEFLWVAVNNFPRGIFIQQVGCGDDIANGDHIGGPRFVIDESTSGNHDLEWQHIHTVYVKGGVCKIVNPHKNDRVSFGVYAPATVGVSNPGAGDYAKSAVGVDKYRFQPVTEGTGDWDLSITEMLNANVAFTKAVPYPNPYGSGYFDFDPETGVITPNAAGTGVYDIYDHAKEVATFVHEIQTLVELVSLSVDGIVATPILPHYKYRVRYHRADASAFVVSWHLVMGWYDIRTGLWGD